jgi:hypothetical protein
MAKRTPTPAALTAPDIDVQATDEDLLQLTNDGNAIKTFLAGLAAWFVTQRQWEKKAEARLMGAKAIPVPTDAASDEVVQRFITGTTAIEKEFESHSTVKGLLHRLHKRASSIHNRVAAPLDEAKTIATNLHNRYADAERRRVAEENARIQREAEQKAQRDRDAELARLEAAALKAEASSDKLSEREAAFVEAYYTGRLRGNATEAAKQAGFKDPFAAGARLLASAKIRGVLEGKRQAEVIREQQAAVKEAPLDLGHVEEVKANLGRAGTDVSRWSADVFDPEAFMAALLDPRTRTQLGIPADCATYLPTKLNDYARSLHEQINRWPGVRAKKDTGVR